MNTANLDPENYFDTFNLQSDGRTIRQAAR